MTKPKFEGDNIRVLLCNLSRERHQVVEEGLRKRSNHEWDIIHKINEEYTLKISEQVQAIGRWSWNEGIAGSLIYPRQAAKRDVIATAFPGKWLPAIFNDRQPVVSTTSMSHKRSANIQYTGDDPSRQFDLYYDENIPSNPPPLICFVHGGAWISYALSVIVDSDIKTNSNLFLGMTSSTTNYWLKGF